MKTISLQQKLDKIFFEAPDFHCERNIVKTRVAE